MLRIMSPGINILKLLVGGNMELSLEEKVIGKHFNGKPLYQKSFEGIFAASSPIPDLDNVEDLVAQFGYHIKGSEQYPIPEIYSGYTCYLYKLNTTNKVALSAESNQQMQFTLIYTKTTD